MTQSPRGFEKIVRKTMKPQAEEEKVGHRVGKRLRTVERTKHRKGKEQSRWA